MTKFKTVPITPGILERYYGEKVFFDVEGLALLEEGIPVAIAGVFFHEGKALAFEEHNFNPKKHPVTVIRFSIEVMKIVRKYQAFAVANSEINGSACFLKILGFVEISEGIYQCQQC